MRAELEKPKIKVQGLTATEGVFIVEPLERGYGMTLGNSLRRVLLSSIPGAAVTRVRFENKYHEYDTIEGVKETVLEIILNLKEIAFRLTDGEPKHLYLQREGAGVVRAGDIELPRGLEIINPDHVIATLNEKGRLALDMEVEPGIGYRPAERNKRRDMPLGIIAVDSDFSPVKRVNYRVEPTRVGERTDFDRLVLEIRTNGGVRPDEALQRAAQVLIEHFQLFTLPMGTAEPVAVEPEELSKSLEELNFDKRACNLLAAKGVLTLKDLLQKTHEELKDIHGFGDKTLQKVLEHLEELGYKLKESKRS
ncbi:MAG: DNA-directed RNA polymerase subunit alpha [Candidatus Bipolaricaulota bacterium]|nr:DNA-directed RNA polymerase subunit alpha [Candidatus Bipolaricaulota bacterium]MCS7275047.1 DNA-directed RNA polymerase subunit alpha [Candidatus Bipolaricaulota bacterium]MDW8110375.1 DNA-directed RNA polymerase subunit alpha [Candidatus Bipolaricaulota bacterium]MDW8329554.1 DNA-directed RNA polymerase subunit alpha [Candidatus Bipolaricaulota bacterium]